MLTETTTAEVRRKDHFFVSYISQRIKRSLTDAKSRLSDDVSYPQVLETRSDAIDSSMSAFELLKTGWVAVGARGEVCCL